MEFKIGAIVGVGGGLIANAFGGFDNALKTLIIFMIIDYVTGLIVAGVFNNSQKSGNGKLQSHAGWKGICKKSMTLLMILIANKLDLAVGTNFIKTAVVITYTINEALSIIENASLMGVPIPNAIKKGIEILESTNKDDEYYLKQINKEKKR